RGGRKRHRSGGGRKCVERHRPRGIAPERHRLSGAMRYFLAGFSRGLGAVGLVLLGVVMTMDHRWTTSWVAALVIFVIALALRTYQVPLTKYGALNFLTFPAIAGSITVGPSTTAVALYAGVFLADLAILRKSFEASWINAGREVLALIAAYGYFAWATSLTRSGTSVGMTTDGLPALALYGVVYFLLSRALLYFSLLWRDKLL